MIYFVFEPEKQRERYMRVKHEIAHSFYQNHRFYVLPFMPEKFRNRVVYFPETIDPILDSVRKTAVINKLNKKWIQKQEGILKTIYSFFSSAQKVKITISPSIYGNLGSYSLDDKKITLKPRYDRSVNDIAMLLVNSLTHYFLFKRVKMKSGSKVWLKKQEKTIEIYNQMFDAIDSKRQRGLTKILDTEFAGKLAEESAKYLEKLKVSSKQIIDKPKNLTKSENIVFNLLLRNKNKLVTFGEIADWLWENKSIDKYSEYAITKLVERLKKKLPKNSIHNQRGTGYLLYI